MIRFEIKRIIIFVCVLLITIVGGIFVVKSLAKENEIQEEIPQEQEIEKVEIIDSYDNVYFFGSHMDFSKLDESSYLLKYEDDIYKSLIGADLSEHNGNVNFNKLKEQGIEFVMLRVAWRGSTEGGIYDDMNFEENYQKAKEAGLKVGYYFFSQAVDEKEAIEEAEYTLNAIKDKDCDMFIAYDAETSIDGDGRIDKINSLVRTNNALAFVNRIKEAGLNPMIYTNLDWAYRHYVISTFEKNDIPIWLAQYDGYPDVAFRYNAWQYTSSARIDGVQGYIDLNLMLVKK